MYETMVLIDNTTHLELDKLHDAISSALSLTNSPPNIERSDSSLRLQWKNFSLSVSHSTEEHVVEEAAELATLFAKDHPHKNEISLCRERLDISATADQAMAHFNDYCYVLGAIEKMGRVYTFSSTAQEFI